MNLILSGGGDPAKTKEIDKEFVKLIGKKKILYIPLAKKTRPFEECYSWMSKVLSDTGFIGKMVMWTEVKERTLNNLREFGGIIIGGGNTFSLLKDFKESNFLELLKEYIQKDMGIVYGISAGAVIFGKDISIAKDAGDENVVNLTDLKSLNLLDNRNIWPHYNSSQEKLIIKNLKKGKGIVTIPEGSGILIIGTKKTYLGEISFFE